MAATALKITTDGVTHHLLVVTIPGEEGTDIAIHGTSNEYKIHNDIQPEYGTSPKEESQYHKDLRSDAQLEGHFVSDFSTNPEWNPGYVEEEKEVEDGVGENGGD